MTVVRYLMQYKQDRVGQDWLSDIQCNISRAGQERTGQDRAGQGRVGQGRAGQGRAGQGRKGQGRVGQCSQSILWYTIGVHIDICIYVVYNNLDGFRSNIGSATPATGGMMSDIKAVQTTIMTNHYDIFQTILSYNNSIVCILCGTNEV